MKSIPIVLAALLAAWAGRDLAADMSDAVAEAFGEATAIDELCPRLKVSGEAMVFYAGAMHVPVDDWLTSAAGFHQRKANATWGGDRAAEFACAAGDRLYGAGGSKGPGLLVAE